MTADGSLIAWVLGLQKYATLVEVESGDLCSLCTCPYDDSPPCKHAVALLLEYMEAKEKNRPIPAASPSDERIAAIDDLLLTSDLEDEGDDEEAEDEPPVRAPGASGKNRSSESDVNRFLSGLTKEELIGLIGEWSVRFPEIADEIAHRGRLSAGNTGALAAAAFRTEEFLDHPSLEAFQTLEKTARRAKVHPQVRNAVLGYLETGRSPEEDAAWPLPETATAEKPLRPRQSRQFPIVSTLIDIAIAEKRPGEALRWYDFQKARQPHGHIHDENRLAGAVAERYPDRAAALWKGLAERQIALVQPNAYREAVRYLGKIREVLEGKGEGERFTVYLKDLRNAHIRKKRLIELLDDMGGK